MARAFIVKEAEFDGLSRNPYRRQGQITRYRRWKTVAKCATLVEAQEALRARIVGLFKRAIWHAGERIEG